MKLLNKKLQEKVRHILMEKSKARDCDRFLTSCIWWQELEEQTLKGRRQREAGYILNANSGSGFPVFLRLYNDKVLTLADSITRARRKLQEEDKTLRGENWYKRKGRAEEVRQEIIDYKYQ